MSDRTILVAHRNDEVRERFAAALTDARHAFVIATDEAEARRAVVAPDPTVSLVLIDLGLADDGVALVRALRSLAGRALPIVVFSGSVTAAQQVASLASMGISGYVNEHAARQEVLPALAPHLFPDNFNRRTSPRVTLGVPVSYRAGQTIAGAVTLDVGKGGLAIRTMNPLPHGATVHLRFRLPGVPSDIEAEARVAWSDRRVGMGVQFEHLAASDQATVDRFVDDHTV
jgi:uncharacterized protein (TIGR02266 family)